MLSREVEMRKVGGEKLLLEGEEGEGSLAAGSRSFLGRSIRVAGSGGWLSNVRAIRGGGGGVGKEEGASRAKVDRGASLAAEVNLFWGGFTLVRESEGWLGSRKELHPL